MTGILFATISAVALGLYYVLQQKAESGLSPAMGAVLIQCFAILAGSVYILYEHFRGGGLEVSKDGLFWIALVGATVVTADFFILKALGANVPVTIVGPIVSGGSIAVAVTIGIILGESISLPKAIGIALVASGAIILSQYV